MPDADGRKVFAIDLDGTVLKHVVDPNDITLESHIVGGLDYGELYEAARDVVNRLKSAGCYLYLWTARIHDQDDVEIERVKKELEELLDYHRIAIDEIWTGRGKPLCDGFWDDKTVVCDGDYDTAFDKLMSLKSWADE